MFASSNHSIGFHERTDGAGRGCAFRPDSFYGLSKAYGELMGRLYWDKHGVENVNVRIGSSYPAPVDARMLASWLSYADLTTMMACCLRAEAVGHAVIWGASNNAAHDLVAGRPARPYRLGAGGQRGFLPPASRRQS